jgi:hypothetical protein
MSEFRRLKLDADDPLQRELLESWKRDAPSPAARERAWVAISSGVSAGLVGTAAAAAPKAATWTAVGLKWIAIGTVTSAIVVAAVGVHRASKPADPLMSPFMSTDTATGPSAAPEPPRPIAPLPPEATSAPPSEPTVVTPTGQLVSPSARAPAPRRAPTSSSTSTTEVDDALVREQLAMIDGARGALKRGDAGSALRTLDAYDRRFPDGALAQEATVVRVQALLAAKDRAGAEAVERRLLTAHPVSPYSTRIRAMMTDSK